MDGLFSKIVIVYVSSVTGGFVIGANIVDLQ